MATTLEYMKFALNVYEASDENLIGVPFGWDRFNWQPDKPSGFSAGAYFNSQTNEMVISYTGTNDFQDKVNWTIGLGAPTSQIYDALDYYFACKAAHPTANITFTGHSLGGGLASLMAVYFNKQATVFDEAPFQIAALSPLVTDAVAVYMIFKGYQDSAFTDYILSVGTLALARESNVTNYYVEGEALDYPRFSFDTLVGNEFVFSMGNSTASPVDLHSMALMTALQYSTAFREVVKKLPDLVSLLADNNLFAADPITDEVDLLRRLLRHEFGVNSAVTPDQMLERFASDMTKLAQEGGLTMSDSNGIATTDLGNVSKALIAFAMQMYYEDTDNAKDPNKELFTSVDGYVQFDIADVSTKFEAAFTDNKPLVLSDAKGYEEYFNQYLNGAGSNFTEEERNLINGMLPYVRDWYVQAGASGMTATDSQNRGAFMLGGATNDTLTGGNKSDLLVGNAGADNLNGGGGDDYLLGGSGTDTLKGEDGNDQLLGGIGSDDLNGGAGNDILDGGAQDDTLDGGAGNDMLKGGNGSDTYNFIDRFGTDIITDTDGSGSIHVNEQVINGGSKITGTTALWQSNDKAARYTQYDHGDGQYTLNILFSNGDKVFVNDWQAGNLGISLQNTSAPDVPILTNQSDFYRAWESNEQIDGGGGNDILVATSSEKITLKGGAGEDLILGYGVYDLANFFFPLDSSDHVSEQWNASNGGWKFDDRKGTDLFWFAYSSPYETSFWRITGTDYDGYTALRADAWTYSYSANPINDITDILEGGAGNDLIGGSINADYIHGGDDDDIMYGNTGNDFIFGGQGKDFAFGGNGNDVIDGGTDDDGLGGGYGDDVLQGGAGNDTLMGDVTLLEGTGAPPASTDFSQSGNDYLDGGIGNDVLYGAGKDDMLIGGNGDDQLYGDGAGTPFAYEGNDYLDGGKGKDQLTGGAGNDYLDGGEDDDVLIGEAGNDTLIANSGNDILVGGAEDDIYLINSTGVIHIVDTEGNNTIRFGANNNPENLKLRLGSLMLDFGNGNQVHIENFNQSDVFNSTSFSSFEFADGTTLTSTELLARGFDLDGTDAVDSISGTNTTDRMNGLAGDDTMTGGDGNDVMNGGVGNDHVQGDAGNDSLDGGEGDDSLLGLDGNDNLLGGVGNDELQGNSGDDLLDGGSGNDTLYGQAGSDTLDGGTGNDVLLGNAGDDIYQFNLGGGLDVIWEEGDTAGDVLRFGSEITTADIIVYQSGADLVLSHVNGIDQVTIANWYVSPTYRLKQFEFADGTIWDGNNTGYLGSLRGSAGNDYIYGTAQGETIYGMAGNDTLYSNGGTDILIGGKGNDYLYGNYSNRNTYVFALGDGADTISGVNYLQDTLRFEADIQSADISAERVGYDLVLRHQNGTDSVTLSNWYLSYTYQLPAVTFAANGTTWSATTLSQMGVNISHNYALNIGDGIKTIEDWGGTDTLTIGSAISDADIVISRVGQSLQIAHVNGVDRVTIKDWFNDVAKQIENITFAASGTVLTKAQITQNFLTLTGTSGNDVLQGGNAYGETILGMGGNDTLYGGNGEDQITGGLGNDTLYGGDGYDTYYFNQGDGQDIISESYQSRSKIVFGTGLLDQMSISNVYGQDTIYTFGSGADKVTVKVGSSSDIYFINSGTAQADNITGSAYNEYIYGLGGNDTILGGDGADWLYGGDGDDLLDGNVQTDITYVGEANAGGGDSYFGGKGNDTLSGNSGVDTYYFNLGDGNDVIIEGSYSNSNNYWYYSNQDTLIFGEGITLENIQVSELNGDLVLKVSATDSVTVRSWFSDYKARVDFIKFDDGRSIGVSDIASLAFTKHGTAGDDVLSAGNTYYWGSALYGEAGNDTLNGGNNDDQLHGGSGNDVLNGSYGNDAYYFERDGGQDQIIDSSGADKVYFDASITAADITLNRSGNDLVLTLIDNGGSLTINSYFVASTNIVETFIFSDGSSLPSTQAILDSFLNIRGTSGDENLLGTAYTNAIYGGDGNDILRGFEGDDILYGDAGNDTLDGGADYDQLRGGDGNDKYIYVAGGGLDTIFDSGGDDSLILDASIGITDLNFEKWGGTDLNISFANGGNVVVSSQLLDANKLERIEFADGNTIALGDIQYYSGNVLTGTANDSILLGDTSNNILNGGDGNDYLVGRDGADSLYGGNGNDWLNGGTGSYADTMVGNAGNDIYYVNYRNDVVTEQLNEGTDTVNSTIAYTLGNNVENLTLTGTASVNGTGNALDNIFRGNNAANAFTGGAGNDTYYLSTGDSAVEGVGAGTDVVYTDATYTMGTNIENGFIIGTAAVNLTGNALANIITGNAAANILNGGAGVDTLTGGLGDDTYIIDVATDVVVENASEGNDTIQVGYATTAATTLTTGVGQFTNIENITVTGTGLYNLTGDAANNTLIGNASANVLTGNAGNDVLNGLAGIDNMSGGFGNDTYTVDVAGDVVTENLNEGTDLVNVAINTKSGTYTLGNNVENGTLINAVAFTLTGNALDNILNGNGVANTLNGGDGNDVLDGKAGSDNMSGGLGNDTYFVDVTGDVVTEAVGAGTDSVNVGIATASGTYTLGANIENGKLTNTVAFNLTGNVLNNYLMGNIANNTLTDTAGGNDILQGLAGIDTFNDTVGNNLFDGGVGNDIMTGGSGRDLFIGGLGVDTITSGTGYDVIAFNKGDGQDTVNASTGADNTLSLGGNFAYSDLSLTKSANDLILKMGATDQITLKDWYLGTTNKSVVNLQVIAEAMQGFSLGSADDLRNNKIENFNFAGLVSQFDAAGATANWQLTDARLTAHLQAGSDSAAIGGDLAYQYGMNSNLTGMGLSNAQGVIAAASFGQTAQTLNNPSVWQAEVVKLG